MVFRRVGYFLLREYGILAGKRGCLAGKSVKAAGVLAYVAQALRTANVRVGRIVTHGGNGDRRWLG